MRNIIAPKRAGLRADLMANRAAARNRVTGGSNVRLLPTVFVGPARPAAWRPSG